MRGKISLWAVLFALTAFAVVGISAVPAGAAIIYDGYAAWAQNSTTGSNTYDASGSDKLVVVVTGEAGNPGSLAGDLSDITYNGQSLIKAVDIAPSDPATGGHGQTTGDIWYLDNPGDYAGTGTIIVSYNSNNWCATAIGLSGTMDGYGATATASGTASVDLTTTAFDSMAIAVIGSGGQGNTAVTPNAIAPLTTISKVNRSGWVGLSSGYAPISSPSTQTLSFDTTKTDIVTVAAEFQPYVPTLYWDTNGATAGAGGSTPTGVWNDTNTTWNAASDGIGTGTAAWAGGNTARFMLERTPTGSTPSPSKARRASPAWLSRTERSRLRPERAGRSRLQTTPACTSGRGWPRRSRLRSARTAGAARPGSCTRWAPAR